MTSPALFLSSRHVDAATVVASTELSTLPATNLQSLRPDKVWRAGGCAAEYITVDFGSSVAATALMLVGHNLSSAATLRWRMAASAAGVTAAPSVDTTALSAWPSSGKHSDPDWPFEASLLTWSNSTGYRYGRLDIADSGNTDGYVEAGRLLVGPAYIPAVNVDNNPALGLASPAYVNRTAYGRTYADDRGPPSRAMQLQMSSIDEAEMTDSLFELQRYCGVGRDFGFCLDPAATTRFHKFTMQALFGQLGPFQAQPLWNASNQVWSATLQLNEVI